MTEHKHAWFFRALADGVLLEDFETTHWSYDRNSWVCAEHALLQIYTCPDEWKVRRKPRTHVVNGFTVPAPETEAPAVGAMFWFSNPSASDWCAPGFKWAGELWDLNLLSRGLVHLNEDAAAANGKAMCGVDPHSKEES
jgi:hypothetical protein